MKSQNAFNNQRELSPIAEVIHEVVPIMKIMAYLHVSPREITKQSSNKFCTEFFLPNVIYFSSSRTEYEHSNVTPKCWYAGSPTAFQPRRSTFSE